MAEKISNKQAICDTLIELAQEDKDIIVLTSDSRGSASMSPFIDKYPRQYVETGIAEQNIVSISAGLASFGKKPVVASPAAFLSMRSVEQVKVDIAYSHMGVVLMGISGGVSYGALGMTHHSLQDIAVMRAIPGIDVILPCDRHESKEVILDLMKNPRPAYIRVGRNAVPDVFTGDRVSYVPGKATKLRDGNNAAIIATGEMVYHAINAADILANDGIIASVYDMHTLKPLDLEAIAEAANTGFVLTMEEHSIYGGLGSAVAQFIASNMPVKVVNLAISDEPCVTGNSSEVFAHYGLTTENAVLVIRKHLAGCPA